MYILFSARCNEGGGCTSSPTPQRKMYPLLVSISSTQREIYGYIQHFCPYIYTFLHLNAHATFRGENSSPETFRRQKIMVCNFLGVELLCMRLCLSALSVSLSIPIYFFLLRSYHRYSTIDGIFFEF